MHQKAEDLFNPQNSWSWGSLSGIKIQDPTGEPLDKLTKLKCTDIKKISTKTKEQISWWINFYKSVGQGFLSDGEYIKGFLKIDGYPEAINKILDEGMRRKLDQQRDIILCNNEYYIPYCQEDVPNLWIADEFLPKNFSANRITYTIRSKYARSPQQKEAHQHGAASESDLISQDAAFILVKREENWLIEEFHTSKYALPQELTKPKKEEVPS
jgi:hypothetical protein